MIIASMPNLDAPPNMNKLGFITQNIYTHVIQSYYIDLDTRRLYVKHTYMDVIRPLKDKWCEIIHEVEAENESLAIE
jgi:hypothetical protein